MQSNGWVKIENDSGAGGTTVSAVVLELNTGRTIDRSQVVRGRTAHGVEATATIVQAAKGAFVTIDHIEPHNGGNALSYLPAAGGDFNLVCYSNVDYILAEEMGEKPYTDLNDERGRMWENGFIIIDDGTTYNGIMPESSLSTQLSGVTPIIGTTRQYMFKIPFFVYENSGSSDRGVILQVEDDDNHFDSVTITQLGIVE